MEGRLKGLSEKPPSRPRAAGKEPDKKQQGQWAGGRVFLLHGAMIRVGHTAGSWNQWFQTSKEPIPGSSSCTQREEKAWAWSGHTYTPLSPACPLLAPPDTSLLSE